MIRKRGHHRHAAAECFAPGKLDDFADGFVDVEAIVTWRRLFDEVADPANHVSRPIAALDDVVKDLPYLVEVDGLGVEESQGSLGIGDNAGDRLVDFMRDRGGELPHGGEAVR